MCWTGCDDGYGFAVGAGYEPDRELIIDPGLDYSTLPRRAEPRRRRRHRRRRGRQRLRRRARRSRPTSRPRAGAFDRTGATSNFLRRLRHQAERNRHGARLFHVPRRQQLRLRARDRVDGAGNAYVAGQTKSSELPHHRRRLRPDLQRRHLPALRHRPVRRLRHQAERRRARRSSTPPSSAGPTSTTALGIAVDGARQRLRGRRDRLAQLPDHAPAPSTRRTTAPSTPSSPS